MSSERADFPKSAAFSAEHRRQDPPGRWPARRPDLVCEELDGEAVIYDARTGAVHHLDAAAHWIWEGCDGLRSREELAAGYSARFSVPLAGAVAAFDQGVQQLGSRNLLLNLEETGWPSPGEHAGDLAGRFADAPLEGPTCASLEAGSAKQAIAPVERAAPSRRELLSRGATGAALAAPVVSTFFATGVYASGPSWSAAFGPGGCKTLGYSCAIATDCCIGPPDGHCHDIDRVCCIETDKPGCTQDEDCCEFPVATCSFGACQ